MDARASSASAAPNREDDASLAETSILAKEAASLFQSAKYAECVQVLNQLLLKKQDDLKVLHNIAIAEYLRDGCSHPEQLLEVLNNVKKKSEISSGEQADALYPDIKSSLVKGKTAVAHQTAANNSNIVYMDEFDASIATLNIAIVWFNLHQYANVISVLEPLYQNIEPIYETTALHICYLLLDAGLASRDASLSADVLLYLEKAFGDTSTIQNEFAKSSSVPGHASASKSSDTENHLSRSSSEEYESMLSTLSIGRQTSPAPSSSGGQNLPEPSSVFRSLSTVDLKLKLLLYKVRFLLLTRNLKQAKREAKTAVATRGIDSSMVLILKAELAYACGNNAKAMKVLTASVKGTDVRIPSIYGNNLGCIYNQMGNYGLSTPVFSRALSNSVALWEDRKPNTVSQDISLLIAYNCGVHNLACGKPIVAAECLQNARLIFNKRPLFWLRLAESCIMASEMGLLKDNLADSDRSIVKVPVVGNGRSRHLVIVDGISENGRGEDGHLSNEGHLEVSLPFARQYLSKALILLKHSETCLLHSISTSNISSEERDSSEAAGSRRKYKNLHFIDSKATLPQGLGQINANGDAKSSIQELVQNSLSYYDDITRRENRLIKQAVLANLAYVELKLESPLRALTNANSLIELPESSKVYTFLGHVYAAEALCLLKRPKEAADHLLYYLSEGNNFKLPFSEEDCDLRLLDGTAVDLEGANGGSKTANNSSHGSKVLKPEEARAVLFSNFAMVSALEGNFEQAQQFVSQALSIIPNRREAYMTAIYIDLALGKSKEAIAKLKQCSFVRFLPSELTMKRSS